MIWGAALLSNDSIQDLVGYGQVSHPATGWDSGLKWRSGSSGGFLVCTAIHRELGSLVLVSGFLPILPACHACCEVESPTDLLIWKPISALNIYSIYILYCTSCGIGWSDAWSWRKNMPNMQCEQMLSSRDANRHISAVWCHYSVEVTWNSHVVLGDIACFHYSHPDAISFPTLMHERCLGQSHWWDKSCPSPTVSPNPSCHPMHACGNADKP